MADYIDTTLVDGFAGGPHITEEQIGLINQGTYGPDDYVLEEGSQAEAEVLTNNSIRIKDAVFVIQGRRDVMAANDYEDISIDNGAQGVNRNDIIVRRYQKDESSEIENTSFAVIKGTATEGAATDPEVPTGDIRTGALLHNMKLYRVRIEGLNIVAVEPLFKVLMNAKSVQEMLAELNSKTKSTILEGSNAYRIISSNINTEQGNAVMRRVGNIRIFSFEFTAKSTVSSDITPYVLNNDDAPASRVDFCFKSGSSIKHGWIFSGSTTVYTDSGVMTSGQASNGEIIYTV